jgi:hypothetical protein
MGLKDFFRGGWEEYFMEIPSQSIEFDKDLISPETFPRTMKRLSNIPKEMNEILQCVGTKSTCPPILETLCQDSSMICDCGNHTSGSMRTIPIILQ